MMAVRAQQDDIECIHPPDERLQGSKATRKSWQHLFVNHKQLHLWLSQLSKIAGEQLSVHILHEKISLADWIQPAVIVTSTYSLNDSGWNMTLHHASLTATPAQHKTAEGKATNDFPIHWNSLIIPVITAFSARHAQHWCVAATLLHYLKLAGMRPANTQLQWQSVQALSWFPVLWK
jgi:hypothetical protein